jgi:hypothetical protein
MLGTDPKPIWYNTIPASRKLSSEEKYQLIADLLGCFDLDRLFKPSVATLVVAYTHAIVHGNSVKYTEGRVSGLFGAPVKKKEGLWPRLLEHTCQDYGKYVSEQMIPMPGVDENKPVVQRMHFWTYKTGNGELCDMEGNRVSEPIALTAALPYYQCRSLRKRT